MRKYSDVLEILRKIYNDMLKKCSPFVLDDLNINGNDLIENFPEIKLENLDELLKNLLMIAAINPRKNNKKELIIMANKLINSKRDFYLD